MMKSPAPDCRDGRDAAARRLVSLRAELAGRHGDEHARGSPRLSIRRRYPT
jgi:hypothetical protein